MSYLKTYQFHGYFDIYVIDAISPDSRQLTDYSKVTLLERVKEIYSGKKNQSEMGRLGVDKREGRITQEGFTQKSKPFPKVDTHNEISEHANISKNTATKIIYINKNLDLNNEDISEE